MVPRAATKCVSLPCRLRPDLRPGRHEVGGGVGRVVVLVGIEVAVRTVGNHLAHQPDGAIRPLIRVAVDHVRAVGRQGSLPLVRCALGHDQRHRDLERGAEHGVGDPGVPRSGVDQCPSRRQVTGGEGRVDDRQRGAILDRSAWVHPLHLEVNLDRFRQPQVPLEATQANERRVADRTNDGGLGKVGESGICESGGKFGHGNAQS